MNQAVLKLPFFPGKTDPKPPRGLAKAGAKLWRETVAAHHLGDAQLQTLEVACRQLDSAVKARETWEREGQIIIGGRGGQVAHPAVVVERNAHSLYLAAVKQLGLDVMPVRSGPGRPPGS
jgi:phage terminase small subunit